MGSDQHHSVEISWTITGKGRVQRVIWKCLSNSKGSSVIAEVYYQPDPDSPATRFLLYRDPKVPKWVPRPPEGWLGTLQAMPKEAS